VKSMEQRAESMVNCRLLQLTGINVKVKGYWRLVGKGEGAKDKKGILVFGSRFTTHDSQLTTHDSRLTTHGHWSFLKLIYC